MRFQIISEPILKSVNDVTIFKSYVTLVFVTDFNFVTSENSNDDFWELFVASLTYMVF